MAEFDAEQMIQRFRDRATSVKRRSLPPVAGEERQQFLAQAQVDFQDFAMIGDADATIDDGVLVLRVDLRLQGVAAIRRCHRLRPTPHCRAHRGG